MCEKYLNALWGALCQTDKFTLRSTENDNEIHEDKKINAKWKKLSWRCGKCAKVL